MDHEEEEEVEIPNYFICPISLEIMKDPVTTVSGITYDRQCIVKWLEKVPSSCPVTKQPLPLDSDLTPNHMLRRLIQHWCVENETRGVVRISTPRAPPGKPNVVQEIKNLKKFGQEALGREDTLQKLEVLAMEGNNRRLMCEAGVHKSLILYVVKCTNEEDEDGRRRIKGLDESLRLLHLIGVPSNDAKTILMEDDRIMESLTWVLHQEDFFNKAYTILLLRNLTEYTSSHIVERLNPEVFKGIIGFLKGVVNSLNRTSPSVRDTVQSSRPSSGITEPSKLDHTLVIKQAVTSALMILLETSSWSRNRSILVDLGAIYELIELELSYAGEKRITELMLGVLSRLCCSANGRAEILGHRSGIAVVTKRLLRVSPAADDRALSILSTVSKFSPENMVVKELVNVGTVEKLCNVLRLDCGLNLKEKAREILKDHFDEWKKFPCIDMTLVTNLLSSSPKDQLNEFHSRVGV